MTIKLITILGARPQFIKAASLSRLFATKDNIVEKIIHTGQHFDKDMSDVFFQELNIPEPHYQLDIHGGGHGQMTGRMLEKIEEILLLEKPDAVIVYGDTNSTLAGALAASKIHIPVIHVEAGLRSYNMKMPEEQNRILTDHLSQFLFCPTQQSVQNLQKENITKGVFKTGDIMFDATLYALDCIKNDNKILDDLKVKPHDYALATIHRAENTDNPENLKKVMEFLEKESNEQTILLPLHPRTRQRIDQLGLRFNNIRTMNPLGYFDMQNLLSKANLVLTDSGGLQKEAYFHQKPCVTLRDETEWVELIDNGWNRLWHNPSYKKRFPVTDYGNGKTAQEIIGIIESSFS